SLVAFFFPVMVSKKENPAAGERGGAQRPSCLRKTRREGSRRISRSCRSWCASRRTNKKGRLTAAPHAQLSALQQHQKKENKAENNEISHVTQTSRTSITANETSLIRLKTFSGSGIM